MLLSFVKAGCVFTLIARFVSLESRRKLNAPSLSPRAPSLHRVAHLSVVPRGVDRAYGYHMQYGTGFQVWLIFSWRRNARTDA